MQDITSLCINICAVISAITSDKGPEPILRQVLSTISQITINQDWDKWMESCGAQMPYLHFHFYSFIDRIWALLAQGATDFNNTNVVMGNRPINNLNLTHHSKAIHVLKALLDQVSLVQSQGSMILVQASIVTKYCSKSIPPGMTIPSLTLGSNPTTKTDQFICHDTKRDPATPNSNESKDRNNQHKKLRREAGGEQPKFDKKAMGVFHL
jgi:hypothetical protein